MKSKLEWEDIVDVVKNDIVTELKSDLLHYTSQFDEIIKEIDEIIVEDVMDHYNELGVYNNRFVIVSVVYMNDILEIFKNISRPSYISYQEHKLCADLLKMISFRMFAKFEELLRHYFEVIVEHKLGLDRISACMIYKPSGVLLQIGIRDELISIQIEIDLEFARREINKIIINNEKYIQ